MEDIQWERAWLWMRLEMLHSYSQEQLCGLENWSTSLQTIWQSKKVEGPLLKLYHIIELRWGDQDIPVWICWPNNPSSLIPWEVPLQRMHLGLVVPFVNHHPISPQEAENIIDIWEIKDLNHLGSLYLPQTVGSRATGGHYQQLPQCCLGLTGSDGSQHPRRGRQHWEEGACMKINLPIFKDKHAKDAVTYQSWRWDLMVYQHAGYRITPSYPMQLDPCKAILESWYRAPVWI